jgi:NAD(P)-dependent dehydrogenase (short-subunit alcohol dehydrogenase family)
VTTSNNISSLEERVAIVTGGGSQGDGIGTGRGAAIVLARHGARVLVVDRDQGAADRTVEMILQEGGTAAAFSGDLTDTQIAEAMASEALQRWGRIDILDNNIGMGGPGTVLDSSQADWDRVISGNLMTMINSSRAVLPTMIDAGAGAIVNISSVAALRPNGATLYSTTKGAVISLTKAMASDHGAAGIRINCIVPGPIYTPMIVANGLDEEGRARRQQSTPLGIEGNGWDVANAVLFLVSDAARFITGAVLPVDGGLLLRGPTR